MDSLITICTGNADADYRVEMSGGAKNIFFFTGKSACARTHTHTHIYIYIYIYLSITSLHEECLCNQNIYIELVFTSLQKIKSKS